MSSVGISMARSKTLKPRPRSAQIWLMAAPPAEKFSSIWRLTSDGNADTPRATTPWLPAKTQTRGRSTDGLLALPGGDPFGQPFEPAEASGRLRQLPVARAHRLDGLLVRARHGRDQAADIVEGRAGGLGHGGSGPARALRKSEEA